MYASAPVNVFAANGCMDDETFAQAAKRITFVAPFEDETLTQSKQLCGPDLTWIRRSSRSAAVKWFRLDVFMRMRSAFWERGY